MLRHGHTVSFLGGRLSGSRTQARLEFGCPAPQAARMVRSHSAVMISSATAASAFLTLELDRLQRAVQPLRDPDSAGDAPLVAEIARLHVSRSHGPLTPLVDLWGDGPSAHDQDRMVINSSPLEQAFSGVPKAIQGESSRRGRGQMPTHMRIVIQFRGRA